MNELNEKKCNKKLLWGLVVFLVLFIGIGSYFYFNNKAITEPTERAEIKPSLKDDFYEYINYDVLKKAKIPSDSPSWSKMYDASETIKDRIEVLTNEILEDPDYQNEEIDIQVELYTDYEGRNERGLSELMPYFEMIDNASTIDEFSDVLMTLDRDLDLATFINYEVANDFYDSTKNVLFIEPINIDGAPLVMFTDSRYATLVKFIDKTMKKYFEAIGYSNDKIETLITQIKEFAAKIQEKSINFMDVTDRFELYKKYTLDEINNEIKNVPVNRILKELKVDNLEFYLVPDMGHYKALDEYYNNENLELLKEIAKLEILANNFSVTSRDNEQFELDLQNEAYGANYSMEEYEKEHILSIKASYISDELQKRYEEKYFTESDKKAVADLVEEVKEYYKGIINNSNWLSDTTKEEAIKKLDNIKVYIGYQGGESEKKEMYKLVPKANGGTLISNMIGENRFEFDRFYETFDEEASLGKINTLEVNAYYMPQNNSINFLAGFKELYENETNYYRLLGYFGTVIGHEISHAFDTTGAQYDENGMVNNWWTEEDKANYNNLTSKIKDYYANYEYMGYKVDGNRTLSENIADLAAMKAMVSIAESRGATNEDFKNLFEAYANLWVMKSTSEYAELLSLEDTHSPNKVRVNAVLSSIDKFYEVYDITENDKMYVAPENRVGLW